MVNISGRSKGCTTCRRRRVKCGEEQPICERCRKGKFECDGPRGITIIREDLKKQRVTERQKSNKQAPPSKRCDIANATLGQLHVSPLRGSLTVVGPEVYICYAQNHVRRNGLIFGAIQDIRPIDAAALAPTAPFRQISYCAVLSFATILFGTQHQQAHITVEGYMLYNNALRQLNQALSDATHCANDEVIVAIAALAISECLVPTGSGNYLKHMLGLETLIALRSPSSFWSQKTMGFRDGVRFMILFASLQAEKPSILARLDWKEAMRSGLSYSQLQEQDLYEVLADCSVLLSKRNAMMSMWHFDAGKATPQRNELDKQTQALLARLCAWKTLLDCSVTVHHLKVSASLKLVETFEREESMVVLLMLYNITLIYVMQIIASIPVKVGTVRTIPRTTTSAGMITQPDGDICFIEKRMAALQLCRLLQQHLGGKRTLDPRAPNIVLWTVTMAWRELRLEDSAEGDWMRGLLNKKGRQDAAQGIWTTFKCLDSLPE